MRKLHLPEQSWAAEDAKDETVKSPDQSDAPNPKPVDPAELSLGYARI
jgi:hypothetical protein